MRRLLSFTAAIVLAAAPAARPATFYAANDGNDGPSHCLCGGKAGPCRSITCAITRAAPGDKIIVGPGVYGDLNANGTLGEAGEETPSPGCNCVLSINKPVVVVSSDGAAATVIPGAGNNVGQGVLVIASAEFGQPGKGFTVTQTNSAPSIDAIVVDADTVKIRGNQVLGILSNTGTGIRTVDAPEHVLIEGNEVIGFGTGIKALGGNKTVRKNHVLLNGRGIEVTGAASAITGNVLAGNGFGVVPSDGVTVGSNGIYGSFASGISVAPPFTGTIQKNDIVSSSLAFGPPYCGLDNSGVTGVLATNNYWGAPTGPGPRPADDVCNQSGGTTTVTPVATKRFKVKAPLKP